MWRLIIITTLFSLFSISKSVAATSISMENISLLDGINISLADSASMEAMAFKADKAEKEGWWEKNQTPSTRFKPKQLIVPASLITVGALGVGAKAPLAKVNMAIRDGLQEANGGKRYHFDDYLQYAPIAAFLVLDYMGLEAKHSFGERLAVGAVTYIAGTALTQVGKNLIDEQRPDTGAKNSFPSGHTMTAFAGAELVRAEYGWGAGLGAYAVAGTVGFMRLYNNRHWLNDILAGAGVGIISARIGYWMLPLSRHIFHIPRKGQMLVASPVYYSENRTIGLGCAIQF